MIFFRKKIKSLVDVEAAEKKLKENGPVEIEKGDALALALAALRVFLPILLGFMAVVYLIYYLFVS